MQQEYQEWFKTVSLLGGERERAAAIATAVAVAAS
jgi:hypothetical protein